MAKRESIWRAADGTEHRSRQSADVADAEYDVKLFVARYGLHDGAEAPSVNDDDILGAADELHALLVALIKTRAALAKHAAKGE